METPHLDSLMAELQAIKNENNFLADEALTYKRLLFRSLLKTETGELKLWTPDGEEEYQKFITAITLNSCSYNAHNVKLMIDRSEVTPEEFFEHNNIKP